MDSFRAYFKIRFYGNRYVSQREEIAKSLEIDGYVNSAEFLKVLAANNLLDTNHESRLKFDTSKITDIDPQTFAVYEYPSITFTLESEKFEVINIGSDYLTILRAENQIMNVPFFSFLYKVEEE